MRASVPYAIVTVTSKVQISNVTPSTQHTHTHTHTHIKYKNTDKQIHVDKRFTFTSLLPNKTYKNAYSARSKAVKFYKNVVLNE